MTRILAWLVALLAVGLIIAVATIHLTMPANAAPRVGSTGPMAYPDGRIPDRIACDTLEQVTTIYGAGKDNIFLMRPMADKIAKENRSALGEPACMVGRWPGMLVTDRKLLGPLVNPIGDVEMVMWAIQVETPSKYRFWIMLIDVKPDLPGENA